jgi:hypothetical protein
MSDSINVNTGINSYPSADGAVLSAGDLIWGVDAIAAELNLTRRQTYHQLETGRLPARKQAGKWVASRTGLRRYFASIVAGEVA